MFSGLKNHPFAIEAFFKTSLVLTFSVPKEQLQPLIPACLTLDTFQDKWAFLAVALVHTTGLRPKGFPPFMGHEFFLIGYRIFVRYTTNTGKKLRGLYILKSETDRKKIQFLGNIFTHYQYTTTDISQAISNHRIEIKSLTGGLSIAAETEQASPSLPPSSPFQSWKEARQYAGPLPFTFSFNQKKKEVLIVQGIREHWTPQPVEIKGYKVPFLDALHLQEPSLASAFIIRNIPYHWKKGRIEKWNG